jgi:hypothetical protein
VACSMIPDISKGRSIIRPGCSMVFSRSKGFRLS